MSNVDLSEVRRSIQSVEEMDKEITEAATMGHFSASVKGKYIWDHLDAKGRVAVATVITNHYATRIALQAKRCQSLGVVLTDYLDEEAIKERLMSRFLKSQERRNEGSDGEG